MIRVLLAYLISNIVIVLGFAFIIAATVRSFYVPEDGKRSGQLILLSIAAMPLMMIAQFLALQLTRLRPLKFDLYVYKIDALCGQPSFILGRLAEHHHWVMDLIVLTYNSLGMVIVGVYATYLWVRTEAETALVLKTFAVNLFLSLPSYLLLPVCGPKYAFASFPHPQASVTPHALAIFAAPNGVPSVHTSSALLILWLLRHWYLGRSFGVLFLALTILATLGSGEHYFFDLLCAVPYAVAVYWIAWRPSHEMNVYDPPPEEGAEMMIVNS